MDTKDLQVENGNFTRIINPLIEALIKLPFKGCELAVALYIIRKTYGYQKTQDEISLSQFVKDLKRSRQTIVSALRNLQLVKVARLVKRGTSQKHSNIWKINKYIDTWELVNMARLVQRKRGTSLTEAPQLVKTARHTKENTKERKEILSANADEKEVFNFESLLRGMLNSKQRHIQIIALYWSVKGYTYENKSQYTSALKRDLRSASKLAGYTNEQLTAVMEWYENRPKQEFEWKLETIHKSIDGFLTANK